ncbi:heme-binding protein [Rhizobium sp. CNPSo 4039]|nr:heme-binding protein [Rhizobium sp. CNPSo 4039]MDK4715983.1 heme-binding protein [Rhizobium sp. CNPSo 4039]
MWNGRPYYVAGLVQAVGAFIPLPGGVLVRDNGKIIGAVGVTGDSPDNDEVVAVEGIKLVGLTPDTGV